MSAYLAEILPYWHQHIDQPDLPAAARFNAWYQVDDGTLAERFGDLVETLLEQPDGARDMPNTAATVIVLDQITRKLFGHSTRTYAAHQAAAQIAGPVLVSDKRRQLQLIEQIALAMTLGNTEELSWHDAALAWFTQAETENGDDERELLQAFRDIAERRREIIRQFGRFPLRNTVLGRSSTPGEAYFVVGTGCEFG
ncbi:DUF924 domain-containing protein [Pseudohalioglobus sediminis]|uniref:DUF924 domain-containing protein n=1 Tax=Pseudohalioglobus sediminis TaxID=2606449 RepID=A0A5B0WUD2_9GAMM|nr:DUF924 family protein [Pseudohalioglobus sediminis]KAA1190533.1 DUF924 domain-containing protein [Pseudohalioglobus sediminis]